MRSIELEHAQPRHWTDTHPLCSDEYRNSCLTAQVGLYHGAKMILLYVNDFFRSPKAQDNCTYTLVSVVLETTPFAGKACGVISTIRDRVCSTSTDPETFDKNIRIPI